MGITGAGGAIIAIPLFQLLLESTLKEATVLSLISVLLGTGVNLLGKTREVKWKIAFGLAIPGAVANILTMPLKTKMPEVIIAILLVLIGVFSIWSVWKSPAGRDHEENDTHAFIIILIGLFLGVVTTLTGLGGGVLLIPLLLKVFGMSYEDALPTSLSSIMLISLSALLIQGEKVLGLIDMKDILLIGTGALAAYGALTFLLKKVTDVRKLKIRQYVFSTATVVSLIIVIAKTL